MKKILLAVALLFCALSALADEGMWMIQTIDRTLEKRMRAAGLKLDGKMIYDEEKESLSDAVVALSFSCTGSMISRDGLMITNHHCAYSDIPFGRTPFGHFLFFKVSYLFAGNTLHSFCMIDRCIYLVTVILAGTLCVFELFHFASCLSDNLSCRH